MKIVIDIPEEVKEVFDKAKEDDLKGSYYDYNSIIGKAIQNGTPLPKGHGRLVDADRIITEATERMKYPANHQYMECVIAHMKLATTIIEADEVANDRKDCPYRQEENGNCLPVGGFCLAVTDDHCKYLKEVENDD